MDRRDFACRAVCGLSLLLIAAVPGRAQTPGGVPGHRIDEIKRRGALRIGTTGDFIPMSFRDPSSGEYRGFDIDAMSALAADIGVRPQWIRTEWGRIADGLNANRFDIFSGASVNEARARLLSFSEPYFEFSTIPVVYRPSAIRLKTWDDLNAAGVRVAVDTGTVFLEEAKTLFPKAQIVSVAPPSVAYREVIEGLADATLTSNVAAADILKKSNMLVLTQASEGPRNRRPAAFAVAKNDVAWLEFVNEWVRRKAREGYFKSLERTWLERN
jgi:cyclohexadienyl dehydratase